MKIFVFASLLSSLDCWVTAGPLHGKVTEASSDNKLPLEALSFDEYLLKFGKSWSSNEYTRRQSIYQQNLKRIQEHNAHRRPHDHWMGINAFTDMEPEEVWKGYEKSLSSRNRKKLQQQHLTSLSEPLLGSDGKVVSLMDPVESLPAHVDWRNMGVTTPVKSQGGCGSCWAFASTAVLESHLALQTGSLFELSVQQLVSCATNPQHCGGTGGCAGSTAEIAFDHVEQHGMVTEWQFGYQSYQSKRVNCTLRELESSPPPAKQQSEKRELEQHLRKAAGQHAEAHSGMFKGAVMGIGGWVSLPSNDYVAVMNAVAKIGPLAVSVACHPWLSYQSGVMPSADFAKKKAAKDSDTDVNHLVVLEGYGTDDATGLDYWLVRNSWGPDWGEDGYIRLQRSSRVQCGVDKTPSHGVACDRDENGQPITPVTG